ncbi:MAG TPA: hypothetical protein VEA38_14700, partial [Terriglobales bacterium]|nr:hypothetical protein [Terriglobales bacterium]
DRLVRLLAPEDVDMLLGHALIGSPLFTTRFRHCALRALFIARTWNGQRTPPYLQRLKADALMESVGGQAEFPVVAETLRECFHDAFDVPRLKRILERIHDGEIRTRHVDTPVPSPFVYPLLLAWDWAYLDAGHAEERRSDAVAMRKAWSVPAGPVDAAIVAAVEAELQKLNPARQARDANEVAALLDELGDLTDEEIAARTAGDAAAMIEALRAERRIAVCGFAGGRQAWIAATDAPLYDALHTPAALERVLTRLLRTRGPLTVETVAARFGLGAAAVGRTLDLLTERGVLRRGALISGEPGPHYVHVAVLDDLQRRQLRARRVPRAVATPMQFAAFLLRRHHVHPDHRLVGPPGVLAALELLQGLDLPPRLWEHELLGARVDGYEREWLDRLGLSGEVVWTTFDRAGTTAPRIGVALRENLGWLRERPDPLPELDTRTKNVLLHLQLRGASFAQELARVTGLTIDETHATLWDLFRAGLVAPDTYSAVVAAASPAPPPSTSGAGRRWRRGQARGPRRELPVVGRWSSLGEDEMLSPDDRAEARAHLLLARYGVLARELADGEWSTLRHALIRMEYGGEVVRGYFVEGLSGEQYALEDALEDLAAPPRRGAAHALVAVSDPANVWGPVFTLTATDGRRLTPPRGGGWLVLRHGTPVALIEHHGREITTLAGWQPSDLPGLTDVLGEVAQRPVVCRPVRRIEVASWDGVPIAQSDALATLRAAGLA